MANIFYDIPNEQRIIPYFSGSGIVILTPIMAIISIGIVQAVQQVQQPITFWQWVLIAIIGGSSASLTVAFLIWIVRRIATRKARRQKQRNDLYEYFYRRYINERMSISGEGGGVPNKIFDRIELLPISWIITRPEYPKMSKTELKLLKEIYGDLLSE